MEGGLKEKPQPIGGQKKPGIKVQDSAWGKDLFESQQPKPQQQQSKKQGKKPIMEEDDDPFPSLPGSTPQPMQ